MQTTKTTQATKDEQELHFSLLRAKNEAKFFSNKYSTSWFVRKTEKGYESFAHTSNCPKTVAEYSCGQKVDIRVFSILAKVEGKSGPQSMDQLIDGTHFSNITQARKQAQANNAFYRKNGISTKCFAVECIYDEKGWHPINQNYHLA